MNILSFCLFGRVRLYRTMYVYFQVAHLKKAAAALSVAEQQQQRNDSLFFRLHGGIHQSRAFVVRHKNRNRKFCWYEIRLLHTRQTYKQNYTVETTSNSNVIVITLMLFFSVDLSFFLYSSLALSLDWHFGQIARLNPKILFYAVVVA